MIYLLKTEIIFRTKTQWFSGYKILITDQRIFIHKEFLQQWIYWAATFL